VITNKNDQYFQLIVHGKGDPTTKKLKKSCTFDEFLKEKMFLLDTSKVTLYHHNGGRLDFEGTDRIFDKLDVCVTPDSGFSEIIRPEYPQTDHDTSKNGAKELHVDIEFQTLGAVTIKSEMACAIIVGSNKNFAKIIMEENDECGVNLQKRKRNKKTGLPLTRMDEYPKKLKVVDKAYDLSKNQNYGEQMMVMKYEIAHEGKITIKKRYVH